MCIQIINRFHGCPHNGNNTPRLTYIDRSACPTKTCSEPLRTEVKWFGGACFGCRGLEAPDGEKIVGWFKHCMFSDLCRHEYSHCEVEGLERYESEEDFILETPSNELCPDCGHSGEASSAPSSIPRGYQGRSHVSMNEFASVRASRVSMASVRPGGVSRMPGSLDSTPPLPAPGNSRVYSGAGGMSSTRHETQRHAERPRHPPPARGPGRRRNFGEREYYSESNT